ncbi:MAG: hypothetical protein KBD48_01765 [Candidatus Pacebacteria bacterium]|nr:hypothetical protein [Candidatus Paceibacterota bacterium]MBP9715897.1 hypothetical protein [Candidatus Paceibacterota bacterium]
MSKTLKIFLIVAIVLIVGFAVYYFSASSEESTLSKTGVAPTVSSTESTTAFLSTLLSLNKIKIDASLFQHPTFSKLQDNTVPISNDGGVVGRPNPFASIDGQNSTDSSISFPQINTGTSTTPPVVPVR